MREIKFRAFYEGKIYQVGDIRFEAKEVCLWNGKGTEFNFIDTSKVALMQFTGLHDKNGAEIYEGDILKVRGFNRYEREWTKYFVVVWDNGFCLEREGELYDFFGQQHGSNKLEKGVVIGNIHENPELLKSEE